MNFEFLRLRSKQLRRGVMAMALAACSPLAASAQDAALTIGSKAPKLDVEHWVQNGEGKFKPVTSFEKGNVYIVEFWATWCGPCIASMPHISSIQKEYADKKVQVVSISDEDLDTVTEFLKREVPEEGEESESKADKKDDKAKTYADVTKGYCLTTDPDGSSQKDYMQAAGQNGIPTAFIVGKEGLVEWIGHPMEMDKPLADIVGDKWDREAFLAQFKAQQEAQLQQQKLFSLLRGGKTEEAMEMIDGLVKEAKDPQAALQYRMMKAQILLSGDDADKAVVALEDVFDALKDQPEMINQITWSVYQMAEAGRVKDEKILKAAGDAAAAAAKTAEGQTKAAVLDTAAHLKHLTGELDVALELQKEAVKLAPAELKEDITAFLEQLEAEKADAKKSDSKKPDSKKAGK